MTWEWEHVLKELVGESKDATGTGPTGSLRTCGCQTQYKLNMMHVIFCSFYLSTYLPDHPSTYLTIHLPTCLSIYLPVYLSPYPSIYLPTRLSIYLRSICLVSTHCPGPRGQTDPLLKLACVQRSGLRGRPEEGWDGRSWKRSNPSLLCLVSPKLAVTWSTEQFGSGERNNNERVCSNVRKKLAPYHTLYYCW